MSPVPKTKEANHMKLIIAVVQDQDSNRLLKALTDHQFSRDQTGVDRRLSEIGEHDLYVGCR